MHAEVTRDGSRADAGYALAKVEKTGVDIRDIRERPKNTEKAAETKDNFSPNVESNHGSLFPHIREAQVVENKEKSGHSRMSRILRREFRPVAENEIAAEAALGSDSGISAGFDREKNEGDDDPAGEESELADPEDPAEGCEL